MDLLAIWHSIICIIHCSVDTSEDTRVRDSSGYLDDVPNIEGTVPALNCIECNTTITGYYDASARLKELVWKNEGSSKVLARLRQCIAGRLFGEDVPQVKRYHESFKVAKVRFYNPIYQHENLRKWTVLKPVFPFIFSLGAGEIFRQWRNFYSDNLFNSPPKKRFLSLWKLKIFNFQSARKSFFGGKWKNCK